ncbi:hypothetical protein CEP88_00465 (plasmid) [Roseobacter denitrificans]|uniref:hypothetical protein n=1 Tax=Roseobacter denitrificans TaxID=2434 RepID=UPI000680D42A|nr:hypothetical protein [Roseobacter denitrificans]AVL51262.1 hypothetical protein CEP88_00465 [Roseobacter denitrificans]SFG41434.1 hypothetical protein SAMN05443635_11671 [Roseobacter denitrificans OCh 114]
MKRTISAAIAAMAFIGGSSAASAQSYDMDCKVILCMAGGFPAGCGDAYSYMIDRITDFPHPKPPFGTCTQSDGTTYRAVDAPYDYLSRTQRAGWACPSTHRLRFSSTDQDHGSVNVDAFCYTDTRVVGSRDERTTQYVGRIPAQHVNFQVQITVEPGTPSAYRSPLYRLNYHTGFVTPSVGG